MDFQEKKKLPNPRESTNPISKLFFWWIIPLFRKGYKNDLVLSDVYDCLKEDISDKLGNSLASAWTKQLKKAKEKGIAPKLYRSMLSVFGWKFMFLGIFMAIDEWVVRVTQTLCLKWLIESFSEEKANEEDHKLKQILYASGVCLTTLLHTLLVHPSVFEQQHIGMKCRVALSSLIYRKALRLSKSSQAEASVGHLVNLLSNDVTRFDINLLMLHFVYVGPVQMIIFTYFLWKELGPSCMAGTGFILILVPVQYFIGKRFAAYRFKIAQKTDDRGRIMNEIIIAMRVIKMYGWEKPFSSLIDHIRRLEVKVLRKAAILRGLYLSLFISSAKVITFLTFVTYVLSDESNILTADKVFYAVAIYNIMRQVMISFVPTAAAATGELVVSMNRIETFLLLEEQTISNGLQVQMPNGLTKETKECEPILKMEHVSASWTKEKVTLKDLNVDLKGDKLVVVCGPVGSGKTSFLNALIAELPLSNGTCTIKGKATYASQEAWIFSGNLRQNILFGHEYHQQRYEEIIRVCALEDDLKQLAFGENTVVGERGVALSGGQKARVNLARALYEPADIICLDDPLSAVDSRVSRHIFEKCIKDYLKGHLRILVTHQLQYLPQADHIIVLNDGEILDQGSYQELVDRGIDFVSLMASETDEDNKTRKTSVVKVEEKKTKETETKDDKPAAQVEKMATGSVNAKLYWDYFKSGDSLFAISLIIFVYLFNQVLYNASEIWLSTWSTDEAKRAKVEHLESISSTTVSPEDDGNYLGREIYIYVYSGLTFGVFIVTSFRGVYFFLYCMRISINVHNKMFVSLVRAPTKFFDDNPSGRIMNRFTKDLGSMDELLPPAFFDALSIFLLSLGVLIVVCISNYFLAAPTIILILSLYFMRRFFIRTARDVKRIESVARSPLFTHIAASLQGLATIRSSQAQTILIHQFDAQQDIHSAAWYAFIAANRWFGIWLEMISVTFLVVITFSFLIISGDALGSNVGLAISSALTLTGTFQWGMRQSAETENLMTSVERALEYSKIEPEAALESKPDKKPPKTWPKNGKVQLKHVYLAYEDKDVLKDLSFDIKGKEKIGIVGRTGAGKSSIIAALFRMTEPRGDIMIDDVKINDIGLHDLRRSISIIPQDPVLFSGTIRYNLDPFEQFKDDELWKVLEEVDLKDGVPALDMKVSDSGSNFSVGQRQLVCLARAILRKNQIIVMDEATANVDPRTDNFIQKTIRSKFADCTIITIAHRLHSVMDCDRILVLDNGYLKEYDHPHILLQNPIGILSSMIGHTGKASSQILRQIAAETFTGRRGSFQVDNVKLLAEVKEGNMDKLSESETESDSEEEAL